MTLVMCCKECGRPFQASDLYWVTVEPPHYLDLPEDSPHVDVRDEGEEPVLRLYYCEECIDAVATPPVQWVPDRDLAPEPYRMNRGDRLDGQPTLDDFDDDSRTSAGDSDGE